MFKNMIVYRIAESWQGDLQLLEDALQKTVFEECGATQERSVGWVAPRGEAHGALVESVAGQWVMRFMTEAKVLPASVLNRKVNKKAEHIEKTEGRKPGKKGKARAQGRGEAGPAAHGLHQARQHVGLDRPAGAHSGAG
jgi:recombination associated protein RdgC